jgi:hypothetical protein
MTRKFGVQAQPAAAAADSFPDPGELNTDNCFCTALLSHLWLLRIQITKNYALRIFFFFDLAISRIGVSRGIDSSAVTSKP